MAVDVVFNLPMSSNVKLVFVLANGVFAKIRFVDWVAQSIKHCAVGAYGWWASERRFRGKSKSATVSRSPVSAAHVIASVKFGHSLKV